MNDIMNEVEKIATSIPLDHFVFWGSLIEEIISWVPSPLVLVTAGVLIRDQANAFLYIIWLSLLASLGKGIGSWLFYELADRGEDLLTGKFGRLFGFSHKEVERIGAYFDKSNKDSLIIFALRAFPLGPSALISLACGFIKVNRRKYLLMTFLGYLIRSFIFLYFGYAGLLVYSNGIGSVESIISIISVIVLLGVGAWVVILKRKGKLKHIFGKKGSEK